MLEYIANQGNEQIDEIRKLAISIKDKQNIAISGEPGNGKSTTIQFVANLLQKGYFPRTVNQFEQEHAYKGAPQILNGETHYADTQLKKALRNGGVFVNEESSELSVPMQKYLSQLLADKDVFTIIDEKGNDFTLKELKENNDWNIDDFVYTETFNPLHNQTGRDNFVDSHKDRMNLIKYNDIDSCLGMYIALRDIGIKTTIPLINRGVIFDKGSNTLTFTEEYNTEKWKTLQGKELTPKQLKSQKKYKFFDRENFTEENKNEYISQISNIDSFFVDSVKFFTGIKYLINQKSVTKDSQFSDVKSEYSTRVTPDDLKILYPTLRLVKDTFQKYNSFCAAGFDKETAKFESIKDAINKITYGATANREYNGSGTQHDYITSVARNNGLLPQIRNANNEL